MTICRTSAGLIVQLEQSENVHVGDYYKDTYNNVCFRIEATTVSRNNDGRLFFRIVEVEDMMSGLQEAVMAQDVEEVPVIVKPTYREEPLPAVSPTLDPPAVAPWLSERNGREVTFDDDFEDITVIEDEDEESDGLFGRWFSKR